MSFVYLASPYTLYADTPERLEYAVSAACKHAAMLMQRGDAVFSPIVHSHYISEHLDASLRLDHEFWMQQDLAVLRHAQRLVALRLAGWEASRGMAREIAMATAAGIPIEYHYPEME